MSVVFALSHAPLLPFSGRNGARPSPQWGKSKGFSPATLRVAASIDDFNDLSHPYPLDSLQPYISHITMMENCMVRHQKHVQRLNAYLSGKIKLKKLGLTKLVLTLYRNGNPDPAFNDAAQIYNKIFFMYSMKPDGIGKPSAELLRLINRDFGSLKLLKEEFKHVASTQFGSGWVWLTYKANHLNVGNAVDPYLSEDDYKLVVVKTPNAVNPLVWDYLPLACLDLWEHAYYYDYGDQRDDYVSNFLNKLLSWPIVSSRFQESRAEALKRFESAKLRRDSEKEEDQIPVDSDDDEYEVVGRISNPFSVDS